MSSPSRLSFRVEKGPWIKFRRRLLLLFSSFLSLLFCSVGREDVTGFGRLFDDDKLCSRARFGHSGGTNSWELREFVPEMELIYRGIDFFASKMTQMISRAVHSTKKSVASFERGAMLLLPFISQAHEKGGICMEICHRARGLEV